MQLSPVFAQLLAVVLLGTAVAAAPQGSGSGSGSNSSNNSSSSSSANNNGNGKRPSLIFAIGDGFGPASETFARSFVQAKNNKTWDTTLALDADLVGSIRTRSTDSLVTDSAASATAYSCGVKSVNAYIGVDIDKKPCGTVLEAAKAEGYAVALVTTSRVTHATPASFSAHIDDRDNENEIASQQIGNYQLGRQVDILWGGGRRHFLAKNATGSSRTDGRDLIREARARNFTVVQDRAGFDSFRNGTNVTFPSLGLFSNSHMAYEIDRDNATQPSLTEMALAALNALKKTNKPYFIMIEAARIDHAAHNNDPIGHVYDIIAHNQMWSSVKTWLDANDEAGNTALIATADHECGGLTLAEQRPEDAEGFYGWYPDALFNATKSTEYLAADYLKSTANKTDADKRTYLADTIVKKGLGLQDAQADEIDRALLLGKRNDSGLAMTYWLSSMLNWRAQIGWSTTGHSGVDVNLYQYHNGSERRQSLAKTFEGNHENTWLGQWAASYLGVTEAQKRLTNTLNNGTWTAGQGSANKTTPTARYHGGVKRILPPVDQPRPFRKRDGSIGLEEVGYSHAANDAIRKRMLAERELNLAAGVDMADVSHSLGIRRRSVDEL